MGQSNVPLLPEDSHPSGLRFALAGSQRARNASRLHCAPFSTENFSQHSDVCERSGAGWESAWIDLGGEG